MTSIRSLALFNGGSCVVAVGWLVTATVTTQDLKASTTRRTKSGDLLLATTGDHYLATSGYFFMATDNIVAVALMVVGIGLVGVVTASVASWLLARIENERDHDRIK